jgi:hypothetical protein
MLHMWTAWVPWAPGALPVVAAWGHAGNQATLGIQGFTHGMVHGAWCMGHAHAPQASLLNLHVTLRAHICRVQALEQGAPSAMAELDTKIAVVEAEIKKAKGEIEALPEGHEQLVPRLACLAELEKRLNIFLQAQGVTPPSVACMICVSRWLSAFVGA